MDRWLFTNIFSIFDHDFNAEILWVCTSVRYSDTGDDYSNPQNCIPEDDFTIVNETIIMGSHYDELQMSCIMTADALTAYFDPTGEFYQKYRQRSAANITTLNNTTLNDTTLNLTTPNITANGSLTDEPLCQTGEISWNQNDTTLGTSPHYLTKDDPFLISNREGEIPKFSFQLGSLLYVH